MMSQAVTISILMTIIGAATPLLLAALGELVVEKSGVLNLGVEGMMLVGAVTAFAVTKTTGQPLLGLVAAMATATAASMIFGFLTLTLASNQVATGLALTIFGIGLSSMIGEHYVGSTIPPLGPIFPEALAQHPLLRVVFGQSILVYVSLAATVGVAWFLTRTRAGLVLRAVGVGPAEVADRADVDEADLQRLLGEGPAAEQRQGCGCAAGLDERASREVHHSFVFPVG